MKRFVFLIFYFFLLQAFGQSPLKRNADNNTLLWQISGNHLTKPSYLFGTFHLMCKKDIHFSDQLKEAIKRSDLVYMEIKLDDHSFLNNTMKFITMRNDTTLSQLLNKEDYSRLGKYMSDSLHLPITVLQNIKPYFLMALLYPHMINCIDASGIEEQLLSVIASAHKEIKGFETAEFQASVFDSIPYKIQATELLETFDSLSKSATEFNQLVDYYKKQQLEQLYLFSQNKSRSSQFDELLINKRNLNWIQQIKQVSPHNSMFIAVGAGHLPGKKGLLQLLKQHGYTVTPLFNRTIDLEN